MLQHSKDRDRHILWALLVIVPAVVFFSLHQNRSVNPITVAPEQHFYIVSVASAVCLALAVVAVRATIEARSARIYLMAVGFLMMSGLFALHGLTSPGYIVDARYFVVTGFSARMALWVGALFLALSAAPVPQPAARVMISYRYHIFAVATAVIAVFTVLTLLFPESIPPRVVSASWFLNGTTYTVFALAGIAVVAYMRLYLKTKVPVYGAVAVGAALMIEAQIGIHWGELWRWSWWMYHLQILGAFVAMLSFPFAGRNAETGELDMVEGRLQKAKKDAAA